MNWKLPLAAAAVAVIAGTGAPAWSQQQARGVTAGVLTCNADSGWGFVFGSTTSLNCTYSDSAGKTETYTGKISKFGLDIGYHAGGVLAWAVLAPSANVAKGALEGTYVGLTASAAAGVGAGANLLVGGSGSTISLQPLSVEGGTGINIAAGIAGLSLTYRS